MAGGIDWFRWHHGSVTDPKFQLVARRSGASLPDVIAVWAYLLEKASASETRGSFGEIDAEALDCMFGFPATETRTADILKAMQDRKLIDAESVSAWDKRQPKRERESDDTAAERKREQRAREAAVKASSVTPDATTVEDVTPCHATSHHFTPRGEERRGEEKEIQEEPTVPVADPAGSATDSKGKGYAVPICPTAEIVKAYAEALPQLPQLAVINEARKRTISTRWRELCATDKLDRDGGLEFFGWFFRHVAESDFLMGRVPAARGRDRPFLANFDWLMAPTNFVSVVEGKYHKAAEPNKFAGVI